MYGTKVFGEILYCESIISTISVEDISFNGYGLKNSKLIIPFVNRNYSSVEYNTINVPQDDGSIFLSSFNRGAKFDINFILNGINQSEIDSKLDEMLIALSKKEGIFKYRSSGTFREIIATMISINIAQRDCVFIEGTISFSTSEPFWYNSIENSKLTSSIITSPFTINVDNTGLISQPKINLMFKTGNTSITDISLTLNNRTISWTGTIVDNDIMLIDCLNKEILLNNAVQTYTGTFSRLETGVNSLYFTINGTISLDCAVNYRQNYLTA